MSYLQKLDEWYQRERAIGNVLDVKFFPLEEEGTPERIEKMAEVVFKTLTGEIATEPLDISKL